MRRATAHPVGVHVGVVISIHALLAESDPERSEWWSRDEYFYPRSPCGERRRGGVLCYLDNIISIHALLAESDSSTRSCSVCSSNFYPRSPCGERRNAGYSCRSARPISIHALLAESDRRHRGNDRGPVNFYPRSPCGERRATKHAPGANNRFLSTLSLRRATAKRWNSTERPKISIHALLAESDQVENTLSKVIDHFYPRSPCGERQCPVGIHGAVTIFLSTLSLRRATGDVTDY